jgi:hypothetical protein
MEKFLGGSPLAVILRLVLICIITGIVLSAFNIEPANLLRSLTDLLRAISELGWDWVEKAFGYFLLGAVIVIPIWLIVRFLKFVSGDSKDGRASRP